MKRASADFHQSHAANEKARIRLKHQTLLQEYLEVQREFVSKKRKLQNVKQKRDTILAEVRFLRRRHSYLLKVQSQRLEPTNELGQLQNSGIDRNILQTEKYCGAYEAELENPYPALVLNPSVFQMDEGMRGKEEDQVVRNPLRIGKNPKSYLVDGKTIGGKKKISWRGPVTLKV